MLLSKPKKRDLRRGAGNIYLVPELCIMTGLIDEMRSDFNMMKDLAHYMRMSPDKRIEALLRFNKDLASNAKVMMMYEFLSDWKVKNCLSNYSNPKQQLIHNYFYTTVTYDKGDYTLITFTLRCVEQRNFASLINFGFILLSVVPA